MHRKAGIVELVTVDNFPAVANTATIEIEKIDGEWMIADCEELAYSKA